jgi:hypothetical protein
MYGCRINSLFANVWAPTTAIVLEVNFLIN